MAGTRFGIGFNHQGFFTTFPTVFTDINADDLDLRNQGPTGIMAILAEGAGFFPPKVATSLPLDVGAPQRFISPSDLLTAAALAARPFPELDRQAGQIFVVPVTPATRATFTLVSSTPTDLATLTVKVWGLKGNVATVKSETGKLTLALPLDVGTVQEVYVYSTVAELVVAINGRSAIATAAFLTAGAPTTFTATAFTGGTEPAATAADYADAFLALNGFRVNVIHAASFDPTIWAMLSDYAIQHRLRGIIGSKQQDWNGISAR